MNGVRFYQEFKDKKRGISAGRCLAVVPEQGYFDAMTGWIYDCVGPVYADDGPNTRALCGCGVGADWLRENCKRVSEAKAREIHPALFTLLHDWEWDKED